MKNNLPQAKKGEDLACSYLAQKGYQIIARNFRSRRGEIDIITIYKKTLIFIEVKSRWSDDYGDPKEAITSWKMRTICRTAEYFKMLNPNTPDLLRIDLIAINFIPEKPIIEHIENISQ